MSWFRCNNSRHKISEDNGFNLHINHTVRLTHGAGVGPNARNDDPATWPFVVEDVGRKLVLFVKPLNSVSITNMLELEFYNLMGAMSGAPDVTDNGLLITLKLKIADNVEVGDLRVLRPARQRVYRWDRADLFQTMYNLPPLTSKKKLTAFTARIALQGTRVFKSTARVAKCFVLSLRIIANLSGCPDLCITLIRNVTQ